MKTIDQFIIDQAQATFQELLSYMAKSIRETATKAWPGYSFADWEIVYLAIYALRYPCDISQKLREEEKANFEAFVQKFLEREAEAISQRIIYEVANKLADEAASERKRP